MGKHERARTILFDDIKTYFEDDSKKYLVLVDDANEKIITFCNIKSINKARQLTPM